MFIRHSKPSTFNETKLLKHIRCILKTGYLSEGEYVRKFEEKLCKFFGSKYAVCVSSGTAGLHLALLSLNVGYGDEVIIPAYTCPAVLNAVLYTQAQPVIVDVSLDNFGILYDEVKKKLSPKTKAIIVPHMFGYPATDIEKIINLGIPVIEDTTQSIGAKLGGRLVGSFGVINVVSFYATKIITTFGEGGAVLTNDKKLYDHIKDIKVYDKKLNFKLRYNYKMTEVQAVMGLQQLEALPRFINTRRKIFQYYKNELKNCNNIKIFLPEDRAEPVYYRFIVQVKKSTCLKEYIKKFTKFGIEVKQPVFLPLDKYYLGKYICKNSKILYDTTLSLPIYPELKKKEINYIIQVTKQIIR